MSFAVAIRHPDRLHDAAVVGDLDDHPVAVAQRVQVDRLTVGRAPRSAWRCSVARDARCRAWACARASPPRLRPPEREHACDRRDATLAQAIVRSLGGLRKPICMDPPFGLDACPAASTQADCVSAVLIPENVSAHTPGCATSRGEEPATRAAQNRMRSASSGPGHAEPDTSVRDHAAPRPAGAPPTASRDRRCGGASRGSAGSRGRTRRPGGTPGRRSRSSSPARKFPVYTCIPGWSV